MLLAIDVGNTQTVIGLFKERELEASWRASTRREVTSDELAVTISDLFRLAGYSFDDVKAVVIASVVPSVTTSFREMAVNALETDPLVVGPDTDTGIPILYDNPQEVGADRVANAVAGFEKYGGPLIVVDFGTATTFDAISRRGEYLGGAIAPGVEISSEALFGRAARLSKVDLICPPNAIGMNTRTSVQSGVMIGTGGLVDRIVERFEAEMGAVNQVIATGGLAELIAPECSRVTVVDIPLTLVGLQRIHERNKAILS
ncbi:MAG TPA: type III pantothenate kinase [Anaerolineae bacterium]|jgi:type III pantothenate kinase|nr:type III pantothenate kinase [Anaerolineae bacterium]